MVKYEFCRERLFWQGGAITRREIKTLAEELSDAIAEKTRIHPRIDYKRRGINFYIDVQGKNDGVINPRLQIRFRNLDLSLKVSGKEIPGFHKSDEELSHILNAQFNYSKLTEIAKKVHGRYDD